MGWVLTPRLRPGVAVFAALGLLSCAFPTESEHAADEPAVAVAVEELTTGAQVWVPSAIGSWARVYSDDNRLRVRGTVSNAAVGLSGVTVRVRGCETCSSLSATSSSTGAYEVVATTSVSLDPNGEDASRVEFTRSGYLPVTVYHTPNIVKYWDGAVRRARTEPRIVIMGTSDSDSDGLSNSAEAYFGTSPTNPDTDGDNLSDNAEVYGANWVDYVALGADPLHYDVFVEIDYEQSDIEGETYTADLTGEAMAKLEEIYGDINLPNPDGATGINLHLMHDTLLPQDVRCWRDSDNVNENGAYRHERWNDAFVYGCLTLWSEPEPCCFSDSCSDNVASRCDRDNGDGSGNNGHFNVLIAAVRYRDTTYRNFKQMAIFAHELGHGLGLEHGGWDDDPNDNIDQNNCKPNYPSLMNYSYDYSFMGSSQSIAATQIQFSPGDLVDFPLYEYAGESEWSAFQGLPAGVSLEFMEYYGHTGIPVDSWHVDFNRDGDFNDWAQGYLADPNDGTAFRSKSDCNETAFVTTGLQELADHNDGLLIKYWSGMLGMPGASRAGQDEERTLEAAGASREEIARSMRRFHEDRRTRARERLRQARFARGRDPDVRPPPCYGNRWRE